MVKPIENDKHLNFELLTDQEMQIFEFHEMSLSHGIPRAGGSWGNPAQNDGNLAQSLFPGRHWGGISVFQL